VRAVRQADRGRRAADLLHRDHVRQVAHVGAAVLLGTVTPSTPSSPILRHRSIGNWSLRRSRRRAARSRPARSRAPRRAARRCRRPAGNRGREGWSWRLLGWMSIAATIDVYVNVNDNGCGPWGVVHGLVPRCCAARSALRARSGLEQRRGRRHAALTGNALACPGYPAAG
jgi:hypothetical protein